MKAFLPSFIPNYLAYGTPFLDVSRLVECVQLRMCADYKHSNESTCLLPIVSLFYFERESEKLQNKVYERHDDVIKDNVAMNTNKEAKLKSYGEAKFQHFVTQ